MDSCRLLDWSVHELWLQYMLNAMTRECPAGYHAVRTEQVVKADRELWTILAQENSNSLRPVNDVPALNGPFKALVTDPRVTMFLLPVPSSLSKVATAPQQGAPKNTGDVPKPAANNNTNKKRKLTRAQKGCPAELKDFNLRIAQGST